MIRALDAATDRVAVADLFRRAGDYVLLETGNPPDASQTQDFFTGGPPGISPATSLRFGLFLCDNLLVAIAELAFGYPNRDDAYLGLLLIDPAFRGKQLGQQMLDHCCHAARARHARRLLIAVLEENTKGHRFWLRMGFREDTRGPPKQMGQKMHVQIRMVRSL